MDEMTTKEFLSQYFMQLRFNDMPATVRAKFDEYVKADDFTGNMKDWAKKLLQHDSNQPDGYAHINGNYVSAPVPNASDPNVLTDDEAKKLFKIFRDTFRAMAANKKDFADNTDATNFMNDFFGMGRLFQHATASDAAETQIKNELKPLLDKNSALQNILRANGVLTDDFSFADLKAGINAGTYNSDPKIQKKVIDAAKAISYAAAYDPNLQAALGSPNFEDIINGFDSQGITPDDLSKFRDNLPLMLRTLHSNKKVRETFANYDNGKIVSHYDNAIKTIAYDDKNSDDYVPPKRDDELTPWQQMTEWVGDTYDQVLKKYISFKGDTLFIQPQAKNIVSAMAKANVKPTDGLAGIVSKANDIKNALQYKTPLSAAKHFDWTVKILGELQSTMPKAFDGALRNGNQLKAIVEEIILRAAEDGKIAEAKTALEVLSVSKYGFTTSKIMDTLKQQDFVMFSDDKLSWNKQEGMQFVSNALDKSIKAAFLGVGYAITAVRNGYKMGDHKTKFRGHSKRIGNKAHDWDAKNTADRNAAVTRRQQLDQNDNATIQAQRATQTAVNSNLAAGQTVIDDNNLETISNNLDTARAAEEAAKATPAYQNALAAQQQVTQYDTDIAEYDRQINELRNQQNIVQTQIGNITQAGQQVPQQLLDNAQILSAQIQQTQQLRNNTQQSKNQLTSSPAWATHQAELQRVKNMSDTNDLTETRISQYKMAQKTIKEMQAAIDARAKKMDTWDKDHKNIYKELMAYWDFLETGRMSHTGRTTTFMPRTAKANQKKFDERKDALLSQYTQNYTMR